MSGCGKIYTDEDEQVWICTKSFLCPECKSHLSETTDKTTDKPQTLAEKNRITINKLIKLLKENISQEYYDNVTKLLFEIHDSEKEFIRQLNIELRTKHHPMIKEIIDKLSGGL